MADQIILATQRTERPAYRFRVRLDGVFFQVRLVYVSRKQRWILDLSDDQVEPLALAIPVVTGPSLLQPFTGRRDFPAGQLFAQDLTGADRDAGRNDLRDDIALIYRPAEDVAAAAGTDAEVL